MLKKILACSLCWELIVTALFTGRCLIDRIDLRPTSCHIHVMAGNCSASSQVLANSLRVVSATTRKPPYVSFYLALEIFQSVRNVSQIGIWLTLKEVGHSCLTILTFDSLLSASIGSFHRCRLFSILSCPSIKLCFHTILPIDDYAKDGGPEMVWHLRSFYQDPLRS